MKQTKKKIMILLLLVTLLCGSLAGCGETEALQDGYYSAEMSDYLHGWKEFVTICVSNGQLVSVEYNAKNESGFIKSWDMNYMRNMEAVTGVYPNLYTRTYGTEFLETGDPEKVDALTGASTSINTFKQLAAAALEQSKEGDTGIAIVQAEEE